MKHFVPITAIVLSILLLAGCGAKDSGKKDPSIPSDTKPQAAAPIGTDAPAGTTDPSQAPVPSDPASTEDTTPATLPHSTEPAVPAVKITKDPYGETLVEGGRASFIAHADNAEKIIWEFVDINGNVYSTDDTITANPGLKLVILDEDDMICLRTTPLSLNGWSVRARFEGKGEPATTKTALITVEDPMELYKEVTDRYTKALAACATSPDVMETYNVTDLIYSVESLSFVLRDMNTDYVPELLVFGINKYDANMPFLCAMYTLEKMKPVCMLQSHVRDAYYWMNTDQIYNEGSGGAAYSSFFVFNMGKTELEFVEGISTTDQQADNSYGDTRYFFVAKANVIDFDSDLELTEEGANSRIKSWRNKVSIPN